SILGDIHSLNPKLDRITLTGGEPLNEIDRVLKIAQFAKSLNIRVRLVTRGWDLNKELCTLLKEAGVTRLQIGLDSSGNSSYLDSNNTTWDTYHSWLRAEKNSFQKTVDSIKSAVSSGLNVSVRYSACKSNLNDIVNTYRFVSELGVSKFKFRLLFPDGRAKNSLAKELLKGEDLAKAQLELIRATERTKTEVEITQPCFFKLRGKTLKNVNGYNAYKQACSCGTFAAYIDSNGDIKYCLFDEKTLGNLFEKPFLKIWNSQSTNMVRETRCPFDQSGFTCSSFKILYEQHRSYEQFMKEYYREYQKNLEFLPA
ncbi:MAG: radical SAM protein, partial [Draconibacterium sp.]|nr:radical SAM protein [Draconibacterium sp.]